MRHLAPVMVLLGLAGCSPDGARLRAQVCKTWYDPASGDTIDFTLILEPGGAMKWRATRGAPVATGTYRFTAADVMEWDLSYTQHPPKDEAGKAVARRETLRVRIDRAGGEGLTLTFLTAGSPLTRPGPVTLTARPPKG